MEIRVLPLLFALGALSGAALAADTPSPALLILNKAEAKLAIVDPKTNQTVAKVSTGEQPHEVAVSSDGRYAFASNYGTGPNPGSTISVIDLVAQKERRLDLGGLQRPHGLYFAGGKLYFTAEGSRVLGRYDPATDKIDLKFDTKQEGTHMVEVSPDGRRMFATNMRSNSVSLVEASGNDWNATVVPVGQAPEGFDVAPNGRELWAAHGGDGGVSVIDVSAKKVVQALPKLTQRSNRLQFTPDGKTVLISDSGNGDLVVIDAASRKETKRMKLGSGCQGIVITPDGARAYVACQGDNAVNIVDLKTLAPSGRIDMGPNSGPDGLNWAVRK
jgi:YVTN family beta-propeller protein